MSKINWHSLNSIILHILIQLAQPLIIHPSINLQFPGIPYPRVNLAEGLPINGRSDTCLAGAGSLLLEFGLLSRLTGDPVYEEVARRANRALFRYGSGRL